MFNLAQFEEQFWNLTFFKLCSTHLKAQDSERIKLLNLKDSYEKKEIEWNKQSSELRGQLIELSESNVSELPNIVSEIDDFDTKPMNF